MKRSPMNRATPGAVAWARKPRKALPAVSKSPKRRERRQETQQAMQAYREAVTHCEANERGFSGPCGVSGPDAALAVHHVTGRGAGGGRDTFEYARLCGRHHREMDTRRAEARAAGLVKRRACLARAGISR